MIDVPKILQETRVIPLTKATKIAKVKWGNDDILNFDGTETGYGIDAGRSNLVIIDCDVKHEIDGVANFIEMACDNEGVPQTFTVETPNGGLHYYFRVKKDVIIPSSAGTLLPGVDVRAHGGYVVGPGSTIKLEDGSIGSYVPEDEFAPIIDLPDWLYKQIKLKTDVKKHSKNGNKLTNINNDVIAKEDKESIEAYNWAIKEMENVVEGNRQTALNKLAFFMGSKKVDIEKSRELINIAIIKGLSEKEANDTFERAYNDGSHSEPIPLTYYVKEFNTKMDKSFKENPLDTEFYSHISLAYNFWKKYRDELLYWYENSQWYQYNANKGIWEISNEEKINNITKNYLEELVLSIRKDNDRLSVSVYKAQERLWQKGTIEAVTVVARGDFSSDEKDLFDRNKEFINFSNGVLNTDTKELLDHDKNYYITKYIPIDYKPDARDEYCDAIIECIHPEEREFLQIMAGQSLLGYQPKVQASIFFYGSGSNGKSTFIDLLLKTSGSYGMAQNPSILLPDNGRENYALADFGGLRTVVIEELPDSKQLNSGALKRLVGTKRINARPIYGKNREFENEATIFVSCNRLPIVTETDNGTWRRLLVVTFPYSFKKRKEYIKNEWDKLGNHRILNAAHNRRSTAEAFVAWRVEGIFKLKANEKAEYNIPQSILDTVEEWNENNDLLLSWFKENIVVEVDNFILITDLLDSFNEWLGSRGNAKVSMRFFIDQLKNHRVFLDNKLVYKKHASVRSSLKHSMWCSSTDKNYIPRDVNTRPSYIEGIKFK